MTRLRTEKLGIPDVTHIEPPVFADARGFFSEVYNRRDLREAGIGCDFVQDNHAFSKAEDTIRGLHFQIPPHQQDKLVRVTRGAILDVAVDIRRRSQTFGQHVSVILSADRWNQLFVPAGFAHGLRTLVPETEVVYKVSAHYAPDHDTGLYWNDLDLSIDWGIVPGEAHVSEKDSKLPFLRDLPDYF